MTTVFTFHSNSETILIYAWLCSQEELRSAVLLKGMEQWQRREREKIVQQLMEVEAARVDASSFYRHLLRYGTSRVDTDTIRATIDESSGIFFKEDDEEDQRMHAQQVTALLLQSIEQDVRLRHNLELLCQTWEGDLFESASALRDFFLAHARLCLRSPDLAFFVPEVVCVQLHQVCWMKVAAEILGCALPSKLLPLQEVSKYAQHEALQAAILEEAMWMASTEFAGFAHKQQLFTEVRIHASSLSKVCRDTAHAVSMQRMIASLQGQENSQ